MIHPKTYLKFINESVGYGVFAKEFIPKGTVIYAKDPLEIEVSPSDYLHHPLEMKALIDRFSYIDDKGYRVISWDNGKYVNHCCHCNTMSTGYGFEIAIRDIEADEEITDEYGIFNLDEEMEVCCGKGNCRSKLTNSDFDLYYPVWDEKLRSALLCFFDVPQALTFLIDAETIASLQEYQKDTSTYRSVYSLKYHEGFVNKESEQMINGFTKIADLGSDLASMR